MYSWRRCGRVPEDSSVTGETRDETHCGRGGDSIFHRSSREGGREDRDGGQGGEVDPSNSAGDR